MVFWHRPHFFTPSLGFFLPLCSRLPSSLWCSELLSLLLFLGLFVLSPPKCFQGSTLGLFLLSIPLLIKVYWCLTCWFPLVRSSQAKFIHFEGESKIVLSIIMKVKVAHSCPTLCDSMDYIVCQAPLSMEFSRQEYWSRLPFPSPGDLPDPGIEPGSPSLQADSLLSEPPGKPINIILVVNFSLFYERMKIVSRWYLSFVY